MGIPIFGSDSWDPHRKQNSRSVSDSEDSGRKIFERIPLLKNQEIGIPIPKFGIPKEKKSRNSIHLISRMMSIVIGQPEGLTMSNHMDVKGSPIQLLASPDT